MPRSRQGPQRIGSGDAPLDAEIFCLTHLPLLLEAGYKKEQLMHRVDFVASANTRGTWPCSQEPTLALLTSGYISNLR